MLQNIKLFNKALDKTLEQMHTYCMTRIQRFKTNSNVEMLRCNCKSGFGNRNSEETLLIIY